MKHKGVWWDPQHPTEQWVGTVRFDREDGATLRIIHITRSSVGRSCVALGHAGNVQNR